MGLEIGGSSIFYVVRRQKDSKKNKENSSITGIFYYQNLKCQNLWIPAEYNWLCALHTEWNSNSSVYFLAWTYDFWLWHFLLPLESTIVIYKTRLRLKLTSIWYPVFIIYKNDESLMSTSEINNILYVN